MECCNLPAKITPSTKIYQPTKFTTFGPCFFFGFTWLSVDSEAEPTFDSEDLSLSPFNVSLFKKSSSRSSPLKNLVTFGLGISPLKTAEDEYKTMKIKTSKHLSTKIRCTSQLSVLILSNTYIKGKIGHVFACLIRIYPKTIEFQNLSLLEEAVLDPGLYSSNLIIYVEWIIQLA